FPRTSLTADLQRGGTTQADWTVVRGDHLDPQRVLVLEPGGLAGLAQGIEAALPRPLLRGRESRQLEDHPRALVQFREPESQGRPVGGEPDLGSGAHVGAARHNGVVLAVAAQDDGRLRRRATRTTGPGTRCATGGTCAGA